MARSLDDLLIFCIGEIAISGEHGVDPTELPKIVHNFYQPPKRNASSAEHDNESSSVSWLPVVDEPFLERVWKWLTKHSDVYVGTNKEGNHLSYSDIQGHGPKTRPGEHDTSNASNTEADRRPDSEQREESALVAGSSSSSTKEDGRKYRVYVSEERMWLAICGHPPDDTKVFRTEFSLLSIIASRRSKGILQGDLVKLSGQDKRSVPKRTDALRDKGYIEKRHVLAKGSRTSLLVLKKLAKGTRKTFGSAGTGAVAEDDSDHTVDFVDYPVLVQGVFDTMKRHGLITRADLKQKLGLTKKLHWKLLGRLVRRFEAYGCLRRVNAASKQSASHNWFYPCVKYLRDPSREEIKEFLSIGGVWSTREDDSDIDAEGEDDEETIAQVSHEAATPRSSSALEEVERKPPIWNPDRYLSNQVIDVINAAGTKGITLLHLQQAILGPFAPRPMEFLLGRLVENWTTVQPDHLRHLSVIRDTALSKIAYFLHYTFPMFQKLVEKGATFWEAVIVTDKSTSKTKEAIESLLSKPSVDEFGFPTTMRPIGLYKGGLATIGEIMRSVEPGTWRNTGLDPIVTEIDGHDTIRYGLPRGVSVTSEESHKPKSTARKHLSLTPKRKHPFAPQVKDPNKPVVRRPYREGHKPTGRPRKYERGTEKLWRNLGGRLLRSRGLEVKGAKAMDHPLVIQMIQDRPEDFDATYLRAVESGAPTPTYPTDVSHAWVEKTKEFLDRRNSGVYVSPTVNMSPETASHEKLKCIIVIKSGRLQECSFSDLRSVSVRKTPVVHFFVSSHAHTLLVPRSIPASKHGEPLSWLMPTHSGNVPKPSSSSPPVKPTKSIKPIAFKFLPSTVAHTIPLLKSRPQIASRKPRKRAASQGPEMNAATPSMKRQKNTAEQLPATPGPRLGTFDDHDPPKSPSLGPNSLPSSAPTVGTPMQRASRHATPTRKRGEPRTDDLQAQSIDVGRVQSEVPGQRSLRSVRKPTAKQQESLQQRGGFYQQSGNRAGSPVNRRSILNGSKSPGLQEEERTYLNSPSHSSPRSVKLQQSKVRLLPRKPSGLLASAVLASFQPPTKDIETQANGVQSAGKTIEGLSGSTENVTATSTIISDTGDQKQSGTPENDSGAVQVQGQSGIAPTANKFDGDEKGEDEDSDATIDLGPDKFIAGLPRRGTSPQIGLLKPRTPKKTRNQRKDKDQTNVHEVENQTIEIETSPATQEVVASTGPRSMPSQKPTDTENGMMEPGPTGEKTSEKHGPEAANNEAEADASSVLPESSNLPNVQLEKGKVTTFKPRKKTRLDVWQGSIGFLRRKIVEDIIDKCNGIVPFGHPLWYAFATAWHKSGRATKPDFRTLKTAVKSLVDNGQVKQFKFAFKDPRGLMTTQAMLARPDIKVNDPIVRKLQKNIISSHPQPFWPAEFEIDPSLRLHDGGPTGVYDHTKAILDEIVQTEHTSPRLQRMEENRKKAELRQRFLSNQVIPFKAPKPPEARVHRLERMGGPHRLIRSKPPQVPNSILPETPKPALEPVLKEPLPEPEPQDEATMAKERLNDRKRKTLPHSLADVPDRRRKKVDHSKEENPACSKFLWDIEKVEKWEVRKEALFDDETPEVWQFINHQLLEPFEEVRIEGPIEFKAWSSFDSQGNELQEEHPPGTRQLAQPVRAIVTPEPPTGRGHRKRKARTFFDTEASAATGDVTPEPTPPAPIALSNRKRKFLGVLQSHRPAKAARTERRVEQLQGATFDPKVLFPDSTTKVSRGPQLLKHMPEEMVHKLIVTFVVVRTLAGGVEKYIDWSIVNQVFPDETEQFLKDRWKTIRTRYRQQINRYQTAFQERFLKAYDNDELPPFNYDDMANNDWDTFVDWAVTMTHRPIQNNVVNELPARRTEFDENQNIAVEPSGRPLRDLYSYNIHVTVPHKQQAAASTPFAIPVVQTSQDNKENTVPSDRISSPVTQPIKPAKTALQAVARSWTLATVLTSDDQFSGTTANAKISTLPNYNDLLEESIKALLRARIITNVKKNTVGTAATRLPARAYDISDQFINTLSKKRSINQAMLKRALWYKLHVMDPAFSSSPPQKIKFDMEAAEDGDMIAVLNLVSSRRIVIRPSASTKKGERIPGNRYGLIEHYQTRFMDKNLYRFAVEVEPSHEQAWVSGNPLLSEGSPKKERSMKGKEKEKNTDGKLSGLVPIPRGGMDEPLSLVTQSTSPSHRSSSVTPARIPIWFSIHSQFLPWIWEMIVSAIAGVLATRPGMSTTEIFNMLHPGVEMEDLRMVLEWMQQVRAVKPRAAASGRGEVWEVEEWWWCLCDQFPAHNGEVESAGVGGGIIGVGNEGGVLEY